MKHIAALFTCLVISVSGFAQEFKIITVVESIIPMGKGRSRIIEHDEPLDYTLFTTERTDGKSSGQRGIKRADAKIKSFSETKLLNFYNVSGINFQNIASNDALISSKLTDMAKEGWELVHITSSAESQANSQGMFISRFFFKRDTK